MKTLPRLTTTLLAAALALSACSTGSDDDSLQPSARGPANVSGQSTCVYIDSPAECQDSGVPAERWFQAGDRQPESRSGGSDDFLTQVFLWHIIYSDFYASPYYVNHYVPAASRTTYITHNTTFVNNHKTVIAESRSKATYRTGSGKTVTGDKVNVSKLAPPKNAGGDRGKACGFLIVELQAPPRPVPPRPAAPAKAPPKPPQPAGVGGDRGKGGANQHGC